MIFFLALVDGEENKRKFEQLYWKYRDCIYFYANQILQNRQDAEDAAQNCFIQIARNMDRIETVESKKTLSLIILMSKHCAVDLYRSRKSRKIVSLNERMELTGREEADPADEMLRVDEDMRGILGELNPRYREILILRFCHGYQYSEIAQFMRISEANARKILQRAREQFEKIYAEHQKSK